MKNIKTILLMAGWLCCLAFRSEGQAALNFDGTNDYVSLGNAASLQLTSGTLEAWVKTSNAGSGDRGIIVKQGAYAIYMVDNVLKVYDWTTAGYPSAGVNIADNAWHHVAFTFQNGVSNGSKLYLDGVLKNTFTYGVNFQTSNVFIGANSNGPVEHFNGSIDEARIWNTVRTQAEIQASMNCELLGSESGLRAYCRLNQSSGTTVLDYSGNGNNGTLNNFALSGNASNWVTPGSVLVGHYCVSAAALAFDGTNDYVDLGNPASLQLTAGTIEFWIKTTSNATNDMLTNRGGFFEMLMLNGQLVVYDDIAGTTAASPGINLATGAWRHVAMSFAAGTNNSKLYVDGTLVSTFTLSNAVNTGNLYISSNNAAQAGIGTFDEYRVWNTVRTQAQIQAFKDCELDGTETGLAAYYKFNQSPVGILVDATSNGNTGTLTNFSLAGTNSNWLLSGALSSGVGCGVGYSLACDATDDYVEITNAAAIQLSTGTIECWIKVPTTGNPAIQTFFSKGLAYGMLLDNGNLAYYDWPTATGFSTGVNLRDDLWHHVALTFAPGTNNSKLYVDGNLKTTFTKSAATQTNNLIIGQNLNGIIDEARVWNTVRSQADLQANIGCQMVGVEPGLVAYYRFNQNIGTTLLDLAGSNHGTLHNFAFTGTTSNWVQNSVMNSCLSAAISGPSTACGNAVLMASGGLSYSWSTGATTQTITVTASGTYSVTATALNGTTTVASHTVTIQPLPIITLSGNASGCDQVSLTASGGVSYLWSNAQASAAATFSSSGTYTVTATSADGCSSTASQNVTVNYATASISGASSGCDQIVLTASGGVSFLWTGGAVTQSSSFTTVGNYVVTVTDVNGCTDTKSHSIFVVQQSIAYYPDADGDGYGNEASVVHSCSGAVAGYILLGGDCNDSNPDIKPGVEERCDLVDDNCNGILFEGPCAGSDAEVSPHCRSYSTVNVITGELFFNYGSVSNSINTSNRTNFTVGQPLVGTYFGTELNGGFGFWTRFLLAPSAPLVEATEGDLPDRVQVSWKPDPLSPAISQYKIYRNGSLLATVDAQTFSFLDFNTLAGQFYTYEVSGLNQFGEGYRGSAYGFLNPNGVVTGQVKSFSGNPVPGVIVKMLPTLGTAVEFDGAGTMFMEYESAFPRNPFTVSCWVKQDQNNDRAGIFDFGSQINKNWWLHTLPLAGGGKGVKFGIGNGLIGATEITYQYPDSSKNDWHYIAASYNGSALLLYVDGDLVATANGSIAADESLLFVGKRDDDNAGSYFKGKIDELRLFNRQLAQTEIQMVMNQTVSANEPGLVAYWKFDEGTGSKGFDLSSSKFKSYLCGANWTTDKPNVVNAGITDATGFYKIEGVNYASGQTFTASPSKNFYFNQSLEFNGVNQNYATLTDFDLADSSTIEITLKSFNFPAPQSLLSKGSVFDLSLNAGNLQLKLGSAPHTIGFLGTGFRRVSLVLRQTGSTVVATFYKDGNLLGSHTFSGVPANFAGGGAWTLGKNAAGNYFTGLIDEVAFFNTLLPLSDIQTFANIGTNVTHPNLSSYFNLNEGDRTSLRDMGTALTGSGTTHGATWSTVAAVSETLPHEFTPSSRLVTLNPSSTSADQIDFTDQSTIPISGYVRFDGTNCFQKGVEIMVDGEHATPPCFTDSLGYFVLDMEPGSSAQLTPVFKEHTYFPAFWEIQAVSSPVAGILFRNQTQRKIEGQLAGNEICRESIIPTDANGNVTAIVKVKVETLDGCYYKELQLTNANGKFKFDKLPPLPFTVAVTEHSNNVIYNYFQLKGGQTVDLTDVNDTTDFIYYSAPVIEMTALDTNTCGATMLQQDGKYTTEIRVYQPYDGGHCYLDTAMLRIENGIEESVAFDTMMTEGKLKYKFQAGFPNVSPPFLKTMTVLAEANSFQSTAVQSAVVLGKRPRLVNFTSTTPDIPLIILRDPPGDASSATIEKGNTICNGWSFDMGGSFAQSRGIELDLGNKQQIISGTPATGTITEIGVENSVELGVSVTTTRSVNESGEVCVTATDTYSTSDGDLIIGEDADVYIGGAMNLLFGITDDLKWDTLNCGFVLDTGLLIFPDKFATTFMYTAHQIKTVVVPNLLLINDTASANAWLAMLQRNANLKAASSFEKNVSFDAGVIYESASTTENTKSDTYGFEVEVAASFAQAVGFDISGTGSTIKIGIDLTFGVNSEITNTTTNSQTVSYVLADDDIGDNFTVDILKDKVYATPVFKTISGNSSCPYEPVTVPRDEVELAVDKTIAANVSMNDEAVFKFKLGNISQTSETREYLFSLIPESNTSGAIVKIQGGSPLDRPFQIPYGTSQEVTVTIAKGPTEFDYENLEFAIFAGCEDEKGVALGQTSLDPKFYKSKLLSVHFLEPCSPIDISFPLENWVWQQADGDSMFITLNEFNRTDADLELIRVQYRRKNGDGAWINIVEVPKAQLDNDVFKIVKWGTQGLQDGEYEIRAITQCFGGLTPGISHVIDGRFEREAPNILGTPEPADGVYSAGDEISITFNEPIRCGHPDMIQADQFSNNNIGLYNAETDELVDAQLSCSGDKIILVPKVPNQFLENKVLRVEVDNIKDLAGNTFVHAQWEFVNDRNNLNWLDNVPVYVSKYEEEVKSVTRRLQNRGGFNQDFEITGIPSWVIVYPSSGTLAPGAVQVITFEFDSTLVFGNYLDTVKVEGALGDEPLAVQCRVVCKDPGWVVNAADWDYSMNFIVQLDIEGTLSSDIEDIVAAYVGTELRGAAKVKYVPASDKYEAFLTVHSNNFSGETVTFRVWDASECLLYGSVLENFAFEADGLQGLPQTPVVLHTNNQVLREIELRPGWNWISFNLAFPNNSVSAALASVNNPGGDLIKSQTQFSQNSAGFGWLGSLTALQNLPMYQYRTVDADTIVHLGTLIDPTSMPISISAGWNWIGYLPQQPMTVNEALASLTALNGDIIKSQTDFAVYMAGFGWIGNLIYMSPPNGYLLKMANAGTLTYPNTGNRPANSKMEKSEKATSRSEVWTVDATKFEHSQTMIAMLKSNGANITKADFELGAFTQSGECRGAAKAIWIEPLQSHLFFLTMYANQSGEQFLFKMADEKGQISDLKEAIFFAADAQTGTVQQPFVFEIGTNAADEIEEAFLDVLPNPAIDYATIRFRAPKAGLVKFEVSDATGKPIQTFDFEAIKGMNALIWQEVGNFPKGVYLLKLTDEELVMVEKVVVR